MKNRYDIFYTTGGKRWFDALPVGNGRLGAMVYGDLIEKIDLSESTCYSGKVEECNNPNALEYFPKVKEKMLQRSYKEAAEVAKNVAGTYENYGTNLPLGNITFDFYHNTENVTNYKRGLCFAEAMTEVTYTYEGITYQRNVIATNVDDITAIRFCADKKGAISFTSTFDGGKNPHQVKQQENMLVLNGNAYETVHTKEVCGVSYCEMAEFALEGGTIEFANGKAMVKDADCVTIYIAIHSDFLGGDAEELCLDTMKHVKGIQFQDMLDKHQADFKQLLERVDFYLEGADYSQLPTDQRLEQIKNGEMQDFNLITTMYQYARYLLISSSRENSPLPTHLQGVWNDNVACRIGWTCDMHLDINTQMNYWPAEITNLSECTKPLFDWVYNMLLPSGQHTAKTSYDCEGFVAHTVSNPWGFTAPGRAVYWGFHMTGGAWITSHMWQHYLYTLDQEFLQNLCYPMLKENCKFFADYMVKDPVTGYMVTPLSHSPENAYYVEDGQASVAVMPTCDIVILDALFASYLEAIKVLGIEEPLKEQVEAIKANMPPLEIGTDGRLKEWMEELVETDRNHRHTTHLMGLHPFHCITPENEGLAKACEKSIEARMTPYEKWEDTGWARSMIMCYYARLWQGDQAYFHVLEMIRRITDTNLFVIHPPTAGADSNVYELDGNTGLCTCLTEMLFQSYDGILYLLPAIPKEWKTGHIKGLKAVNGFTVDIYIADNQLEKAVIVGEVNKEVMIRYNGQKYIQKTDQRGELVFAFK
ncbi:MAG: glycoside hydrolase family 95 protein [Eubacteriales bacterium]